jgi:molecular chaperone DnaK
MAAHNKTLGRFELVGIPSAPRGVPQIEVKFDIDANGIIHVHAKDLGTGKEQAIQITASSGLSEEEIKRIIKEAELHAEEDKKQKEKIDTKNQLDNLIYNGEKTLKDHGDKISETVKTEFTEAISSAKKVLERDDIEEMKKEIDKLNAVAGKAATEIYQKSSQEQNAGASEANAEGSKEQEDKKEDVVDADYKEV